MGMKSVHFEIPDEMLYTLNENISDFTMQVRLFTALRLFSMHKLSLGKAAQLSGMNIERFKIELDSHDIPLIDYEPSELERELKRFEK